ncbi:hypothetical protein ACFLXQ_02865 [Chloroflexota bacterium]
MPDKKSNIGGVNISGISDSSIQAGDISTTIPAGGDGGGRDKIVNNVNDFIQQALSAVEEAEKARSIATQRLAEGVRDCAQRLAAIATTDTDVDAGGALLAYRYDRDRAVEMGPENGQYYNSRGIVRLQLNDAAGASGCRRSRIFQTAEVFRGSFVSKSTK